MKTLAKIFLVSITFFTLTLTTSGLAVANPPEPTSEANEADSTTKEANEFSWLDVQISLRVWGVKIWLGKNETKHMAKLISEQGIEGVVSACKAIMQNSNYVNKVCTYAINFFTDGLAERFTKAAEKDKKTCLSISYLRKWTVKEIAED